MTRTWYEDLLACPDCGGELSPAPDLHFACACGFRARQDAPTDLRPVAPLTRSLSVNISSRASRRLDDTLVERPLARYDGPVATRDSRELFSAVPASDLQAGNTLLDLGCGPRDQAPVAEHLRLRYVGADYLSPAADVLADAHALPFRAAAFDLVFAYAVLEHLYHPFQAAQEVVRVLKPGGVFFGTVSQGEPFHDSFFHHTAWGLLHVCDSAGLRVERLWYSYDTLRALAVMGRYPKLGRILISLLDRFLSAAPMLSPRKFFRWSHRQQEVDALHRAASICFVARKPS